MQIIAVIMPQKICQPPPTPPPKNEAVGRKGYYDKYSSDINYKGVFCCSIVIC